MYKVILILDNIKSPALLGLTRNPLYYKRLRASEAGVESCVRKKLFWKGPENSQENMNSFVVKNGSVTDWFFVGSQNIWNNYSAGKLTAASTT